MSAHSWQLSGQHGGYNRYVCERCHVTGYAGGWWPPLRIGRFIMPEFRDCERAKAELHKRELQKYGLWEEGESPEDKLILELARYGCELED